MRVAASSNPQSLASAISHAIYDNRSVTLRAIGAGAVAQAMKALAIARGFVAPRGFDIAVVPGWANVTGSRGDELSAMTFRVIQIG
jgi:stage V sporulation protein S